MVFLVHRANAALASRNASTCANHIAESRHGGDGDLCSFFYFSKTSSLQSWFQHSCSDALCIRNKTNWASTLFPSLESQPFIISVGITTQLSFVDSNALLQEYSALLSPFIQPTYLSGPKAYFFNNFCHSTFAPLFQVDQPIANPSS